MWASQNDQLWLPGCSVYWKSNGLPSNDEKKSRASRALSSRIGSEEPQAMKMRGMFLPERTIARAFSAVSTSSSSSPVSPTVRDCSVMPRSSGREM